MPSKTCIVIGCDTTYKDKSTVRHLFPRDVKLFKIWVYLSRNPKLRNLGINEVHKSFVMCEKHFADDCRSPGTKKLNGTPYQH